MSKILPGRLPSTQVNDRKIVVRGPHRRTLGCRMMRNQSLSELAQASVLAEASIVTGPRSPGSFTPCAIPQQASLKPLTRR